MFSLTAHLGLSVMDPMKAYQLAGELEVEMMTDMFNR